MNKWVKALVILIVLFLLFVPLIIATKYIAITQLYDHFVTTLSNLTGINQYLINAGVVLLMVPLYFGIKMFFSINRERRLIGICLLAVFLIIYNLGLYQLTKDVQFSFSDGKTMKWYALTPEGVKFYDRSGVEPVYGIQLKPVTPEVIRHLKLIEKGEFNKVAPENSTKLLLRKQLGLIQSQGTRRSGIINLPVEVLSFSTNRVIILSPETC